MMKSSSAITMKTTFLQLLSMSGQDHHFDMVVADRLNKLDVPGDRCEEAVKEAIDLLEQFYDKEVEARGGTLSAVALTDIMKRGIDALAV
jgi:hypothetical protein